MLTKLLQALKQLVPNKNDFRNYIVGGVLGVVGTIFLFSFTSQPSTSDAIKEKLKTVVLNKLQSELGRAESIAPEITRFLAQDFDVNPMKSIVMFGIWEPKKDTEDLYRWIAIFEPQEQGLLDKIAGRPGFYQLKWFGHIEVSSPDLLVPSKVEVMDFDGDGIPEIHIKLKSTWGDSTSVGPLILKRYQGGEWQAIVLPSISVLTSQVLSGNLPSRDKMTPGGQPYSYFGMATSKHFLRPPIKQLANDGVYEDKWTLTHNGEKVPFVTLRNGGTYQVQKHPFKDYMQFATVAFFDDGNSVLGGHYAVVNFLILGERELKRDLLWNWGFPMVSIVPLKPKDIELDSVTKAGIAAHIIGNVFYGYTEFERLTIDENDWLTSSNHVFKNIEN